ncbi:MAG: DegV family protein [Anaerolineales bacterium]|nr:MAG: DegV family protein [Anaerolineales bacterium]
MVIKIVTDSTCDLPDSVIKELDISVVPLFINLGEQGYLDGVEISRTEFYTNLATYPVHPTTGTPGPRAFLKEFDRLVDLGADEIISIHISEKLSATIDVARKAAAEYKKVPVEIVDSGQLSMGTGFQVELAAQLAKKGKNKTQILAALDDIRKRTFVTAGLTTLEFLRRSGRMNRFMTGIGSLIQLKPILTMKNGLPGSDRVRTSLKAEKRLVALLEELVPIERFALLHTNANEKAQEFLQKIRHLIPESEIYNMDITPVIGAHLGPGAVGFAVISKGFV